MERQTWVLLYDVFCSAPRGLGRYRTSRRNPCVSCKSSQAHSNAAHYVDLARAQISSEGPVSMANLSRLLTVKRGLQVDLGLHSMACLPASMRGSPHTVLG